MVPPPISVDVAGSPADSEAVPPTPTVVEMEGDEHRPSMDTVSRRRGGVCITEPNHRTIVTMDQIKEFYDKA
ncbi:hypothetical protein HK405_006864 [Cladochytrium tenue]|nr:hypothetical protein HK405_006864 [Cladochytrium tenue]